MTARGASQLGYRYHHLSSEGQGARTVITLTTDGDLEDEAVSDAHRRLWRLVLRCQVVGDRYWVHLEKLAMVAGARAGVGVTRRHQEDLGLLVFGVESAGVIVARAQHRLEAARAALERSIIYVMVEGLAPKRKAVSSYCSEWLAGADAAWVDVLADRLMEGGLLGRWEARPRVLKRYVRDRERLAAMALDQREGL